MDLITFMFGFRGRISRGKYWIAVAIYAVAVIAFSLIAIDALRMLDKNSAIDFLGGGLALWVSGLSLTMVVLWSGFATGIKRLHDRDKSGWWILLFWLAPMLLVIAERVAIHGVRGVVLWIISAALTVWAIIELGCLPGTPGPNNYGPDPLLGDGSPLNT